MTKASAKPCLGGKITPPCSSIALCASWRSSFEVKELGLLVDLKLNTSRQCALVVRKSSNALECTSKTVAR